MCSSACSLGHLCGSQEQSVRQGKDWPGQSVLQMTTIHISLVKIQIPQSYVLQQVYAKCINTIIFPIFCQILAIISEYDILNSNSTSRGIWFPHSLKWGLSHLHFPLGIPPLGASVTNLQLKGECYIFNLFWVTIWGAKIKTWLSVSENLP